MVSKIRSWLIWLIPFFVSGGMAFGVLISPNSFSNAVLKEGATGDIAGAALALMVVICIIVGFVISAFTIIVARVLHRNVSDRIILRFGLSIIGGYIIGALVSRVPNTAVNWLLLICGPILITWSCVTGKRFPTGKASE